LRGPMNFLKLFLYRAPLSILLNRGASECPTESFEHPAEVLWDSSQERDLELTEDELELSPGMTNPSLAI